MRTTALMAVSLTLFMVILVLVAAFVFLYQGRQTLEAQVEAASTETADLQQTITQTQIALLSADATRQATTSALVTAEANSVLLEGQLVESEQQIVAMSTETADLNTQLQESRDTMAQVQLDVQQQLENALQVQIVTPTDGLIVPPNEPVELVVVAVDAVEVSAVYLTINGETAASREENGQKLVTLAYQWVPALEGEYALSATAVNISGHATTPVTLTMHVIDVEARNDALRDQIEANVVEIRGLEPIDPIVPTFLSREELGQRIEDDFEENSNPIQSREDTLVLSAFDFVDPNFDLYQAYIDLYSEQILGFYDPETAEFVLVSDDNELGVLEQWTHAHEFTHALQDQYYQLELISSEDLDSEASTALRAMAEGEAEFVQFLYLTQGYFTADQQTEIIQTISEQDTSELDNLPPILINSLTFPYNAGFEFILTLYNESGGNFDLIDEVWLNLPVSTEQILHPERYFDGDEPQLVTLPPLTTTLGTGWERLDEDIFGEFYLREYLKQQIDDTPVDVIATGWGGDRYAVYWNETAEELVMVLRLVWDSPDDSEEFSNLYPAYPAGLYGTTSTTQVTGGTCWQGNDVTCFYQQGGESLIVRAPDVETAELIAQQIN